MKFFWIGMMALMLGISACGSHTEDEKRPSVYYTCSMHPQIHEKKPGKCPLCGMALVPVESAASHVSAAPKSKEYICTMCPEVKSDKQGDCPVCGMKLVLKEEGKEEHGHESHAKTGAATVQLMPAQNNVASIAVEKAIREPIRRNIRFFGEIAYIQDSHKDFTWFYGGRVERVLVDYNTSEVKVGTPLIELYSEEAIADQERYLQALRAPGVWTFES